MRSPGEQPGRVPARGQALFKSLFGTLRRTCERYALLAPGDRIAVAVSGGKDSMTLLLLLQQLVRALPFEISLSHGDCVVRVYRR